MQPLTRSRPRPRFFGTSGPSFALDFVNGTNALDTRVTFTRASSATYFDSAGVLQSAAIDVPRFDYNPATLAAQGLLIEESRTNGIRNSTGVGAVAGTPGTAPTNWVVSNAAGNLTTREIVGTGTENGITYIDVRFAASGAVNASIYADSSTGVAALNGQTWTSSFYIKLVGGSLTNLTIRLSIVENDSGGNFLAGADGAAFVPTSAALRTQRFTQTYTNTNASTAFEWSRVKFEFTGAGDVTLRIGLPQLELGAFATSVIPTTTTALTRSADVASVNTLSPWFNASEGTLYAEYSIVTPRTTDVTFTRLDDGSDANRVQLSTGASFTVFNPFVITANAPQGNSVVLINPIGSHKTAAAFRANSLIGAMDGILGAEDTVLTVPSGISRLCVGNSNNVSQFVNGYLRRITYYNTRLSNAQLQALTAP